ncbi:MAG: sigma-54 dependent transcriptional regulator [Porticoccus sp.]
MHYLQILVVDDEPALRQILSRLLTKAGHSVFVAENGEQALQRLSKGDVDVALCDIRMPDITGLEVVSKAKAQGIETLFLMMTAFASVNTAVEAMRAGAYDYMVKPVRNDDLLNRLANLGDIIALRSENEVLRELVLTNNAVFKPISASMQRIDALVDKVAVTDSTVLVTGESGTGKGYLTKDIHQRSQRADNPFIPVNCGAIPENLMESEFFGHTKGAFTGALKAKRGLFVEADQGTIFLDEIGELPLLMQVKLLHVIEDGSVRAVGSEQARTVDVRIIAATNRNLREMVDAGTFREDLYFRLNVFNIELPALRDRREDIPGLVEFFLAKHVSKMPASQPTQIGKDAMELLCSYNYGGNIRELENVIARAVILAERGLIGPESLPEALQQIDSESLDKGHQLKDQVRRFERDVIQQTITESGGDRKLAAKRLGLGLSSLYRKLEEASEIESL